MNSPQQLGNWVTQALEGNRSAMEELLRAIQPNIYKLCVRFMMCPHDAEDETQNILLKITLRLSQFQNRSGFNTWVYRIATNHLLDKSRSKKVTSLSFDEFSEDLQQGMEEETSKNAYDVRLLAEVRIGCTLAILQCLAADLRVAYIIGEILEFSHTDAAHILNLSPATYRKRISRARQGVITFMKSNCGLISPSNNCRCNKKVSQASRLGRVSKERLLFVTSNDEANQFPVVLEQIRKLEYAQRTAALFRAQNFVVQNGDFSGWLQKLLSQHYKIDIAE